MTGVGNEKYLLKGEVKRAYSINVEAGTVFDFLSDLRTLLSHAPHVTKVQLRKTSGKARLFFSIPIMGTTIDAVMDVEPALEHEVRIIRLQTPESPLDNIPTGYLTGVFNSTIKVTPKENGETRITSHILLSIDATQVDMFTIFPPNFLEGTAQKMLQEYVDRMSLHYIDNLAKAFPNWDKDRKKI